MNVTIDDITIREQLQPGDLGCIISLHGHSYGDEYHYGIEFEAYVAAGLAAFYHNYDKDIDRVWICEHNKTIIGFLLLMHRENNAAQLRYFILAPGYRGIGLGNKLMQLFIGHMKKCGYTSAYLWTTKELAAAAHLYTKYGFRLMEEKTSGAFGKEVTEQRYEWFP